MSRGGGAVGPGGARLPAGAGGGGLRGGARAGVEGPTPRGGALSGPADLGRPKAEAAADALRAREPGLTVTARVADFRHGAGLAELRSANLVLSCLDSVADRIALASRCGLVGVGLLDAGTYPWGGEVRYYPPGGACFACGCTPAERALATWHAACADPPEHVGASAPVPALTASWQSAAAVRLLFGLPVPRGAVRLDPVTGESVTVALKSDPDCPCHQRLDPRRITPAGLTSTATVADLLALVQPDEQALAWQQEAEMRLSSLADDLDDARLLQTFDYTNSTGHRFTDRVEEPLLHMFLHSQQYRGEAAAFLNAAGHRVQDFDFIIWIRLGQPG